MQIAVISDIHGNMSAFSAVMQDIQNKNIDKIISLGDVATLGPQPKEVLKILMENQIDSIMGNHDEALLNPGNLEKLKIASPLESSITWCRDKLNSDEKEFISHFKTNFSDSSSSDHSILFFHGSPESNTQNLYPEDNDAFISSALKTHFHDIYFGGHTHRQMHKMLDGLHVINPGSVGCGFKHTPLVNQEPQINLWAEYAIINLEPEISVNLLKVGYDLLEFKAVLKESSLPIKNWWLNQMS